MEPRYEDYLLPKLEQSDLNTYEKYSVDDQLDEEVSNRHNNNFIDIYNHNVERDSFKQYYDIKFVHKRNHFKNDNRKLNNLDNTDVEIRHHNKYYPVNKHSDTKQNVVKKSHLSLSERNGLANHKNNLRYFKKYCGGDDYKHDYH